MTPCEAPSRAGRICNRRTLATIASLVLAALLSAGCLMSARETPNRVMYVYFDNDRSRAAFKLLDAACESLGVQRRHGAALEFVGVEVTNRAALASALAQGLERRPAAIVAPASEVLVEASRQTGTIPIVFVTHQDPVQLKVAASLVRFPANLTGISFHIGVEMKMLELLREAAPRARRIGYVIDREESNNAHTIEFLETTARRYGLQWKLVPVDSVDSLERDILAADPLDAWFVPKLAVPDHPRAESIPAPGPTPHPAIYPSQWDVRAGAPMAHEAAFDDPYSALARQIDRV